MMLPPPPPRPLRRLLRLLGPVLVMAAAILAVGAPPASAHAVLVDSNPRDGARVERMPTEIVLRFDEAVGVTADAGRVLDTAGHRVDGGAVRATDNGRTVIIPIRHDAAVGNARYLVSWRVISADSHVVTGSLRFGVGVDVDADAAGQGASGLGSAGSDRGLAVLSGVGTGLGYAGLVPAVGCLAVALLVWRSALRSRPMRFMIIGGTVMVVIGALIELLGTGAELSGSGWSGLLGPEGLRAAAESMSGRLLQARILAAAAAMPLALGTLGSSQVRGRSRWLTIGWAVVAGCLLVIVAGHGHAAAGQLRLVALAATVGHLAAMCCWVGGVLVLVLMVRPRLSSPPTARRVLAGWSSFAFGCVALLIISGELLGWRQIQPIEGLWRTRYGVILLIKLGLVALSLLVALLNRRLVGSRTGLARTTVTFMVELSIMVGIIGMATALSSTAPATNTYGPPVTISRPVGDDQLKIRIDSTRRGPQAIAVRATEGSGRPVRLRELSGRLSSDEAGVSAIDVHFTRNRQGWRSTDAVAPLPGGWTLQLTAGLAGGPAYVVAADYRVW